MISAFGIDHGLVSKGVPKGMKRLRLATSQSPGGSITHVTATRRKKKLGSMMMHNEPGAAHHGRLMNVEVEPQHQRKGIATAMWQHAERSGIKPQHSPHRTDEGQAWASKVGGKLPNRVKE
jgi:ribosomal protein S18 acetylase RimI-like enzyme